MQPVARFFALKENGKKDAQNFPAPFYGCWLFVRGRANSGESYNLFFGSYYTVQNKFCVEVVLFGSEDKPHVTYFIFLQ